MTCKNDAIEILGHHEFKIEFVFGEEHLYFIRKTSRYNFVSYCNEKYEELGEEKLSDYNNLLKKYYGIALPYITFRKTVGLYSRIWGKNNYDTTAPLQQNNLNMSNAVKDIIMLFDKYTSIKSLEDQITELDDDKKAIDLAVRRNYLPKINKTIYNANEIEIASLNDEIDSISADTLGVKTDIDALITKEVLELKEIRSNLVSKKGIYQNRLARTKVNLSNKNRALNEKLSNILEFFPTINMEKLSEIDSFHFDISKVLKKELKNAENELSKSIVVIEKQLKNIDDEINTKLNIDDSSKYIISRLADLISKVRKLEEANDLYDKKIEIVSVIKKAKEDLKKIKSIILQDISAIINNAMYEINKQIVIDDRKSPSLQLLENKYSFRVAGDTGTGTSYTNLITLDLAIIDNTLLPALIHDSILFKNIENPSMENIIKIYNAHTKQIFISIDEIKNKFTQETVKVLEEKSVLTLSHDHTLFIKDWKNEEETKEGTHE